MRDLVLERRQQLAPTDPEERKEFLAMEDPRSSLAGLALSGGGIRSATFALGVLQALGERGLLTAFDYLSTVSGGGYIGGWWSAWLSRPDRKPGDTFPADERLEPDRFPAVLLDDRNVPIAPPKNLPKDTPGGSRSAWLKDPIHHLRLFSNYLTPRKGVLSGDTWRAITVVSRNLVLTWAVFLPVLLAAVLVAQLYFAGHPTHGAAFACSRPEPVLATASPPEALVACSEAIAVSLPPHGEVVRQRVRVMVEPFVAAGIVVGTLILLWMLYGGGNPVFALLGFGAVAGGVILLVRGAAPGSGTMGERVMALLWTDRSGWVKAGEIGALAVLVGGLGPLVTVGLENLRRTLRTEGPLPPEKRARLAPDRIRNLIVRWHGRILVGAAVAFLILVVAGFGHELVWFLFAPESGAALAQVRKAGGWTAVALSVGSGILAALRAGPTKKGKDAAAEAPKLPTKVLLAIAPPLVLAALAVAAAALGHWLYETRAPASTVSFGATVEVSAALVGIALLAVYTLYERWSAGGERDYPTEAQWRRLVIVGGSLLAVGGIALLPEPQASGLWSPLGFAILFGVALATFLFRLTTTRPEGNWSSLMTRAYARDAERQADRATLEKLDEFLAQTTDERERAPVEAERHKILMRPRLRATLLGLAFVFGALVLALGLRAILGSSRLISDDGGAGNLLIAGFGFGVVFLALDLLVSRRDSDRSTWLAGLVTLASAALLVLLQVRTGAGVFLVFGTALAIFLIAAVVGLGWPTDPNLMALHNFYKARLVRSFLGASNPARKHIDITEVAATDDIPLKDLKNQVRGAPIQIVNTTLNLVGGRDLATAQRFAAPFTLSSEICGSARTGYHRTDQYMSGTLKLGSAIATSGAAVSTNMGSKTMSSALSLLLAFFNVRLGIWAPTPNRERWHETRPRLWPFYLLREALSQTNDVGPYCYLTDGGHFDNTGLYALVERGCRYLMVIDSGADPQPCFADMGEAVRRCRIDFGAEIEFHDAVDKFLEAADGKLAKVHYARGTIHYAESHLRMLGWEDPEIAACSTGIIVWIKPMVTPKDSVDVRQYKLENEKFPHQTTADQWYDESQFESYRALGYQSMITVRGGIPGKASAKSVLEAF